MLIFPLKFAFGYGLELFKSNLSKKYLYIGANCETVFQTENWDDCDKLSSMDCEYSAFGRKIDSKDSTIKKM